jgi:hypothetical protein
VASGTTRLPKQASHHFDLPSPIYGKSPDPPFHVNCQRTEERSSIDSNSIRLIAQCDVNCLHQLQ